MWFHCALYSAISISYGTCSPKNFLPFILCARSCYIRPRCIESLQCRAYDKSRLITSVSVSVYLFDVTCSDEVPRIWDKCYGDSKLLWNRTHCDTHGSLTHFYLIPPPPPPGQNGRHFTDDAFVLMKRFVVWFEFHWRVFLKVQLTTSQHWF